MSDAYSRWAFRAFSLTFRPWLARRLAGIHVCGLPAYLRADQPLVLVANHVSWYDAFLLWEVQRILRPGARRYWLMLESELRRRPFLRRIGAIGMDPASATSVAHATRELERRVREHPDSVVFFFPQGAIWPSFRRPLGFQRGVELLARRLAPATLLPVALHLEPLAAAAPTAFVAAGTLIPVRARPPEGVHGQLEEYVAVELDRMGALLARHGEQVLQHWPGVHDRLPVVPPPAATSYRGMVTL